MKFEKFVTVFVMIFAVMALFAPVMAQEHPNVVILNEVKNLSSFDVNTEIESVAPARGPVMLLHDPRAIEESVYTPDREHETVLCEQSVHRKLNSTEIEATECFMAEWQTSVPCGAYQNDQQIRSTPSSGNFNIARKEYPLNLSVPESRAFERQRKNRSNT